jgi:hypothetical protein
MPSIVQLEYRSGYARIGMGGGYTIQMLGQKFFALVRDDWSLYPGLAYRRLIDGTILHHTVSEYGEISEAVTNDLLFELPERTQKDAGRGTEINSASWTIGNRQDKPRWSASRLQ